MLTFSQFKQHQGDNEEFGVTEGAYNFNSNQLRHYSQQLQRQIDKIANEIGRKSNNEDTRQLAKMLIKLTALMGLSLAQDSGDRRMLVTSLLQEDK